MKSFQECQCLHHWSNDGKNSLCKSCMIEDHWLQKTLLFVVVSSTTNVQYKRDTKIPWKKTFAETLTTNEKWKLIAGLGATRYSWWPCLLIPATDLEQRGGSSVNCVFYSLRFCSCTWDKKICFAWAMLTTTTQSRNNDDYCMYVSCNNILDLRMKSGKLHMFVMSSQIFGMLE